MPWKSDIYHGHKKVAFTTRTAIEKCIPSDNVHLLRGYLILYVESSILRRQKSELSMAVVKCMFLWPVKRRVFLRAGYVWKDACFYGVSKVCAFDGLAHGKSVLFTDKLDLLFNGASHKKWGTVGM